LNFSAISCDFRGAERFGMKAAGLLEFQRHLLRHREGQAPAQNEQALNIR
jgi:hypothetical protein